MTSTTESPALRSLGFIADPKVMMPLASIVGSVLVGLVLIALTGAHLSEALGAFFDGAFGSPYAISASVNRAVVFTAIGLGFIFANQANLLKVRVGTNEVISSLLLSFIGVWLLYWSVQSVELLRQPMTNTATLPETLEIPDSTQLLSIGDSGPLNIGLVIVMVLAVLVQLSLKRSVFGVRLRAIGLNELASRRAGIPYNRFVILAMAVSGAFAGLAGTIMLQGDQYVLKDGFTSGYGFDGLVVGLLARGSAFGVVAGALFFGFLRSGGLNMEMVAHVPSAVVVVMQGVLIVAIAASGFAGNKAPTP